MDTPSKLFSLDMSLYYLFCFIALFHYEHVYC